MVQGITGDKLVVVKALELEALRPQLERLLDNGIFSLAVVFMHAYAWPEHELAAVDHGLDVMADILAQGAMMLWAVCQQVEETITEVAP